jgi:hypothetical protein
MNTHEKLTGHRKNKIGSNRAFGLTIATVFFIIGFWPLYNGDDIRSWALYAASFFLLAALFMPKALGRLNRLWMMFGSLLNKVMEPVIMTVIFVVVFVPFGVMIRIFKPNLLSFKSDKSVKTYWLSRNNVGTDMKNQF